MRKDNESNRSSIDPQSEVKRLKSIFIQNTPNISQQCNVQINRKTFQSTLKPGDVLEITPTATNQSQQSSLLVGTSATNTNLSSSFGTNFNSNMQNDDHSSPILLQLVEDSFRDDVPIDTIRIDSAAGLEPFNINKMSYVNVRCVQKAGIELDLVELIFKEQYFNGSDMWRLKMQIENTCLYVKKNIEYCGMRCSVREMWMNGEIVTCGYVSQNTRLVFRSQSAMCTIYIQMSAEMWEFDVNGEMYHEKAINFLAELFTNWRNQTCQHDTTITLFSRVFYEANSIDEFPPTLTSCIRQDHKKRFFEDFYRVVYQNERYEDWMFSLVKLKRLVKEYRDYILHYHERNPNLENQVIPKCYLSNAAEGNFLETLNLSSSVFERHFIDRPFDRTGMMSMIVTGGRGVFEVSRDLSKITKERVIDNGIGSDLVCLGEQPLHQVPLFKYAGTETYSVPHWINLSFYKSSEIVRFCNSKFVPRIKIKVRSENETKRLDSTGILPGYDPLKDTFEDSDEIMIRPKNTDSLKRGATNRIPTISETAAQNITSSTKINHHIKSDDQEDDSSLELDSDPETTTTNQSLIASAHSTRKKINPFSPSTIRTRMSFDRRRWAHLFPLKPDGTPIFQHWITVKSVDLTNPELNNVPIDDSLNSNIPNKVIKALGFNKNDEFQLKNVTNGSLPQKRRLNEGISSLHNLHTSEKSPSKMGGSRSTSENDPNAAGGGDESSIATMITGVAWKSLTIPACLPLTTDYCPSQKTWSKNFKRIGAYNLLMQEIREEHCCVNTSGRNITMKHVLPELVGHRLAMGFQLVRQKITQKLTAEIQNAHLIRDRYRLSFGRMYHDLFYLVDEQGNDSISVEIHVPNKEAERKPENEIKYKYEYRFQVPDSKEYHVSYCDITRKDIKQITWNKIDVYICIQGNGTLSPLELQNCWRQRLYLLPLMYIPSNTNSNQPILASVALADAIKQANPSVAQLSSSSLACSPSSSSYSLSTAVEPIVRFDVYQRKTIEELKNYRENFFIRFMEYLNKVTRASDTRLTLSSLQKATRLLKTPREKFDGLVDEFRVIQKRFLGLQTRNKELEKEVNNIRSKNKALNQELTKHLVEELKRNNELIEKSKIELDAKRDEVTPYVDMYYRNDMVDGMPFLVSKNDIPPCCFISAEATWWCIQNVSDIETEQQAIAFLQRLLDVGVIQHISKNEKTYIHGFYLYYIITKENARLELIYTKDYCEVGLCDFDCGIFQNEKNLFFSQSLPQQSKMLPVYGTDYFYSQFGINANLDPILKMVNVDVDPIHKSTRIEWASAIYRSYHHPLTAFELELYWKMATGQLLAELVNNWAKMSVKFNYHIVPGPIDPFTSPLDTFADPLRGYIHIQLSLKAILSDHAVLFEDFIEKKYFDYRNKEFCISTNNLPSEFDEFLRTKYKEDVLAQKLQDRHQLIEQDYQEFIERERILRLQYFQEAILERFGFVRNAAITKQHNSDDDATFFIHTSGGMFVLIPNYYATYTGRSRHASAANPQIMQQQKQQEQQEATAAATAKRVAADSVDSAFSPSSHDDVLLSENNNKLSSTTTLSSSFNQNLHLNNAKSFENETKSLNFIDSEDGFKNEMNGDGKCVEKLAYSHDSIMNSSTSEAKILENHVNFKEKTSSISYNPSQASSSTNSCNNITTSGPLNTTTHIQRARSNTRSQIQFYEINKNTINIPASTGDTHSSSSVTQLNLSCLNSFGNSVSNQLLPHYRQSDVELSLAYPLDSVDSTNSKNNSTTGDSSSGSTTQLSQTTTKSSNDPLVLPSSPLSQHQIVVDETYSFKKKLPFYSENDLFIGFLWSWNFMLGKRWRSQYTGDEIFQDSALADFRAFCLNKNDRLVKFFNDSKPYL